MRVKRITTTLALAVFAIVASHNALAAFERVAQAYEVKTKNFTAPASANGGIVIRECDACRFRSIRVTTATAYSIDGESLTLDNFKDALAASRRSTVTLTVLHDLESDTVVRISATMVGKRTQ